MAKKPRKKAKTPSQVERDRLGLNPVEWFVLLPFRMVTRDDELKKEIRWALYLALFAFAGIFLFLCSNIADRLSEEWEDSAAIHYQSSRDDERERREFAREFTQKSSVTLFYLAEMQVASADWWQNEQLAQIAKAEIKSLPEDDPAATDLKATIADLEKGMTLAGTKWSQALNLWTERSVPMSSLTITARYLYPEANKPRKKAQEDRFTALWETDRRETGDIQMALVRSLESPGVGRKVPDRRSEILKEAVTFAHPSHDAKAENLNKLEMWLYEIDWLTDDAYEFSLDEVFKYHVEREMGETEDVGPCALTKMCTAVATRYGAALPKDSGDEGAVGAADASYVFSGEGFDADEARSVINGALVRLSLASAAHLDGELVDRIRKLDSSAKTYDEKVDAAKEKMIPVLDYVKAEGDAEAAPDFEAARKAIGALHGAYIDYLWKIEDLNKFLITQAVAEMHERVPAPRRAWWQKLLAPSELVRLGLVMLLLLVTLYGVLTSAKYLNALADLREPREGRLAGRAERKGSAGGGVSLTERELREILRQELARDDDDDD